MLTVIKRKRQTSFVVETITMNQLQPYVNFNGTCKEAMLFYQHCLGGDLEMQKISESPMAMQMAPGKEGQILHASLRSHQIQLIASDINSEPYKKGNNIQLSLQCMSMEELKQNFASLKKGGKVITAIHQTFWGAHYGELRDQFGIRWMLHFSKK